MLYLKFWERVISVTLSIQSYIHNLLSSTRNEEIFLKISEFIDYSEEVFPRYYMHSDIINYQVQVNYILVICCGRINAIFWYLRAPWTLHMTNDTFKKLISIWKENLFPKRVNMFFQLQNIRSSMSKWFCH